MGEKSASSFPADEGPVPWPDGSHGEGRITWTGVAGFRFDLGDTAVAFDPFVTRPGLWRVLMRAPAPDAALAREHFGDLDAIFVGHTHYDHAMDLAVVAAASPRARIVGTAVTIDLCGRMGIDASRLQIVGDGDRVEVGPFAIETIASAHGWVPLASRIDRITLPERGLPRTPFRFPQGDGVLAWRLAAADRVFHVQGSAGIDDAALERQAPVDALLACLAARRHTERYLERLGARLRPRVLVPCHHDDFFRALSKPPRLLRGIAWRALLDDAARLADRHGTRLWCPPRGRPVAW